MDEAVTPLTKLVKRINRKRVLPIFNKLSNSRFINLHDFLSFNLKPDSPLFILFKYRNPIQNSRIELDSSKSAMISRGKMHYLYSSGIPFGYLFEFPVLNLQLFENFFVINSANFDLSAISNIEPVLRTKEISVYSCSDMSVVVLANNIQYVNIKR